MIIVTNRTINVAHPVLIREYLSRDIGHMSLELMEWLKARLMLAEAIESDNNATVSSRMRSFRDPQVADWDERCRLAATRGYRPAFIDWKINLTPLGREKAETIRTMFMDAIMYQRDHPPQFGDYDPSAKIPIEQMAIGQLTQKEHWTKAEHCFLSMEITKRQYNMLQMLDKAMKEAEATNRTKLDEKYRSAKSAQMLDEELTIAENAGIVEEVARLDALRTSDTVTSIQLERSAIGASQSFQAIMLDDHPEYRDLTPDLSRPPIVKKAFVPTAMFGQRARNDLNILVRYGLVDLKAWITGVVGRPRHVVRVSEVGSIVINDPEIQAELY